MTLQKILGRIKWLKNCNCNECEKELQGMKKFKETVDEFMEFDDAKELKLSEEEDIWQQIKEELE